MLFIQEAFLVYKLETFKTWKEVKHITDYYYCYNLHFFFYLMWYFISSLKFLSENLHNPPGKIYSPIFTKSHLKIQRVKVPSFCQNWKFFRTLCRKGGDTGHRSGHRSVLHKITIDLLSFWDVYNANLLEKNIGRSTAYSCRTNVFM